MRLLELFSGTGSVGSVFAFAGWEVVSLDPDPKTDAIIHEDILTWVYTITHRDTSIQFGPVLVAPTTHVPYVVPKHDEIWFGRTPWCCTCSKLLPTFSHGRGLSKTPQTEVLKDRAFMHGKPYAHVDYCCHCNWGYRKRTRLWNNMNFTGKLCRGRGRCPNMDNRNHKTTAQQGRNRCIHGNIIA